MTGLALVEFVLAAPVLFLLMFAIVDFGQALALADNLAYAADAGVAYAYQHWKKGDGAAISNLLAIKDATVRAVKGGNNAYLLADNEVTVEKICGCPGDDSEDDGLSPKDCADIDTEGAVSEDLCDGYGNPQIIFRITTSKTLQQSLTRYFWNARTITRSSEYRVQ
ncbi:hypothetical protein JCM19379_29260 [Methyloparacoccus murrellii]